ncbi:MAG: winged helix-turn-helix domain-containing protein [candidate division WOR-3 bacterium]|nr:winged helix-turn-helix domain-containing protein [candidate division WOR-3 bacterium]MDH5684827.1 winged helix-turn-helix domain-containing protein [candidate division WOR-3 bacterium]
MDAYIRTFSENIRKMIERQLRIKILKEQEAHLKKEMVTVQNEIKRLQTGKITKRAKPKKPAKAKKSTRTMLVEVLKRTKRPMTVKELTRKLLERGYRSARKDQTLTVDSILRANPKYFRKTAPSTFEITR